MIGIDSYGVDHNGFSTRDELAYQFARDKREGKLLDYYQSQGINDNYPQLGTDFWGNNAADNYGFGSSDIEGKIDNHPTMNQTPFPKTRQDETNYSFGLRADGYDQRSLRRNSEQTKQGSDVWSQQSRRNIENDLLMDGMDLLYGMNRTVNGMTFGGLDWLGKRFGIDTQMRGYLDLKDEESRRLAQMAGNAAELGGAVLTGRTLNNAARYGYDQILRWNGRRNLTNQLKRGNNFKDIRYRNISNELRDVLNQTRRNVNQSPLQNNRITIPANVVRKWYDKRIIHDGMTPEELADSVDNSIYNPNSIVFQTKYGQNQAVVNSSGNKLDIGFISVNPANSKQNVIKSDYQIKVDDLYRTLFGKK